jgi:hypothetical protein
MRSICVWGVGAQRVRGYGCASTLWAPNVSPRFAALRALPAEVLGPVLNPPYNLHR